MTGEISEIIDRKISELKLYTDIIYDFTSDFDFRVWEWESSFERILSELRDLYVESPDEFSEDQIITINRLKCEYKVNKQNPDPKSEVPLLGQPPPAHFVRGGAPGSGKRS